MRRIAIFLAITFSCGCRQSKTHLESHPAATPQPAQVAAIPTPMQVPATPAPMADSAPFVITTSTKWKTVEEFDYQRKTQVSLHVKLEIPEGYDDPGDFIRIHIQPKGHPDFVLDNHDGWVEYVDQKYPDVYNLLKDESLVQSKYVLILPGSKNQKDPPLIFLRSWSYASDPERLHIIGLQPSGDPFLLFNDEFALMDFGDIDGDGIREIIGFPCLSEGMGAHAGTYHPYQVYKIAFPVQEPATLSIPLSERYTKQKYNGWAGPQCSSDHYIIDPEDKNQKPRVVDQEQFEKLKKRQAPVPKD